MAKRPRATRPFSLNRATVTGEILGFSAATGSNPQVTFGHCPQVLCYVWLIATPAGLPAPLPGPEIGPRIANAGLSRFGRPWQATCIDHRRELPRSSKHLEAPYEKVPTFNSRYRCDSVGDRLWRQQQRCRWSNQCHDQHKRRTERPDRQV